MSIDAPSSGQSPQTPSARRPSRPERPRAAETIAFRHLVGPLRKDPLQALSRIVQERDGAITRLNLGLFRPYLVTRPDDVKHVLLTRARDCYPRQGLMWDAMQRLVGDNIGGEGDKHAEARRALQPQFAARHLREVYPGWAPVVTRAVDDLLRRRAPGEAFEVYWEVTRVIHRAVNDLFFGGRISVEDAELVGQAVRTATTSIVPRLLAPWMPNWIPIPGDRRFRRSVRTVDRVIQPLVTAARQPGNAGIASMLAKRGRTDRQIRDELVALAVAGSESTAVALSWLPVMLADHPDIEARLYAEIDAEIGGGTDADATPTLEQLERLTYTKRVLRELLRMYTVGWIIPRAAQQDDQIDGVRIAAGSIVVISPYLTHRLPRAWPEPDRFDPDRFTPEAEKARQKQFPDGVADLAFGYGHHACLGQQFFEMEALLILASLLRRRRLSLHLPPGSAPIRPKPGLALNPDRDVQVTLEARA
ncbi:cytochrome P450 [Actinomadura chibensis]|uniref:Cytochrome P450 n=1 Tax=Actinomadura chibensis TaxID=392828 RepID=A0A5D0NM80_9ACTN|nr:cytochrome P450 [Actinomadura chibensis]TYB45562.1 cytochrome P450 [Actinomadura chibensis]